MWKRTVVVLAVSCVLLCFSARAQASDPVRDWNQIGVTLTLTAVPAQAPVQQSRTMAIVQVSVHDAVNAITGGYNTYSSPGPVPANASPEAAAIGAAYAALKTLFPSQTGFLDSTYAASLALYGIAADDPGLEFGKSVAAAIVALRAQDGAAQAQFDYLVPGAGTPGVWERINNAPALLPGFGNVVPWVLRSGDQFRPDAPPALTTEQYAKDLNEVKELGSINSTARTAEQTGIAIFWRASPTTIWNRVLSQVLAARTLDLSSTARAFALMYLAAADVSIACWDAKYVYNYWRPQRAIANADLDDNPDTVADPTWVPLLPTPPHPEYPSGHNCNSSAMASVLGQMFGNYPGITISLTLSGVTREWQSFDQGLAEVEDARIYSGIHFRTADEAGLRLGRQVAQFVMTHALRPASGTWKN